MATTSAKFWEGLLPHTAVRFEEHDEYRFLRFDFCFTSLSEECFECLKTTLVSFFIKAAEEVESGEGGGKRFHLFFDVRRCTVEASQVMGLLSVIVNHKKQIRKCLFSTAVCSNSSLVEIVVNSCLALLPPTKPVLVFCCKQEGKEEEEVAPFFRKSRR